MRRRSTWVLHKGAVETAYSLGFSSLNAIRPWVPDRPGGHGGGIVFQYSPKCMESFIGVDIGTSSIKVCLIDRTGAIRGAVSQGYELDFPQRGWAEQDADEWWVALQRSLSSLRGRSGVDLGKNIAGIGLSGQMHTLVAVGADNNPVRPAISWTDQRTVAECDFLRERLMHEVFSQTGNPPSTGFTFPKLLWIRNHEPEIFARIRTVLLPKDYIRFRLTGEIATDYSDASGTLLFDTARGEWSDSLLSVLRMDRSAFPPVLSSVDRAGALTNEAAKILDLTSGIPVSVGSADVAAAFIGSGAARMDAAAALSLGSAAQIVVASDSPITDPKHRLNLLCHALPGRWLIMGAIQNAGIAVDWCLKQIVQGGLDRPALAGGASHREANERVAAVKAGSEGVVFLPYLTGERTPHMDEKATGVFFGLRTSHTAFHLYRAVLEGVSYALRDALAVIEEVNIPVKHILAGGGGTANRTLLSILADVLARRIAVSTQANASAYGAALYALCTANPGFDPASGTSSSADHEVIAPNAENVDLYARRFSLYRRLYSSLRADFRTYWDVL